MALKTLPLPDNCRQIILGLCSTQKEMMKGFALSEKQASDLVNNRPFRVSLDKLDLIQSICANELRYALRHRIEAIMADKNKAIPFVFWVNTAARMLDMFRSIKDAGYHDIGISGFDPFISSLYHMASSMDEVADFLEQLHQNCPGFDVLFFRGTRFLEDLHTDNTQPDYRVPLSVDVLSLSPEDERIYEQLYKESK